MMNVTNAGSAARRHEALARLRATLPANDQSVASRMEHVRSCHCSTPRDGLIRQRIKMMKASLGYGGVSAAKKNTRILFVTGESNSGKSHLVDHALNGDPCFDLYETMDGVPAQPLVRVIAPTPCTLRNLGVRILKAMGYPVIDDMRETRVWPLVAEQIAYRQVIFLVIEEAQRTMKMEGGAELQKVSDTLIDLVDSDTWPIRLLLVGVDPLPVLRTRDDQMAKRSLPITLGSVPPGKTARVERWISEIVEDHASLALDRGLDIADCAGRLVHACSGNAGSIIELVRDTVEVVLVDGHTKVGMTAFAQAYHNLTGCLPHDNVFEMKDWKAVPEGQGRIAEKKDGSGGTSDGGVASSKAMKAGERPR